MTAPAVPAGPDAERRLASNRAVLTWPALPEVTSAVRGLAELLVDTTGVGLFVLACVLGAAADTAQHLSDALLSSGEHS